MALSSIAQENLNNILTALDEQMQTGENEAFQAALKYYNVLACFGFGGSGGGGGSTDVSLLAKELTLAAIRDRLPELINSAVPVIQPSFVVTPQWTVLTTNTTIPEGSVYVYLTVLTGTVTMNGLTKTANEANNDVLNLESCLPARHPEITIVIPNGASVELIRGY